MRIALSVLLSFFMILNVPTQLLAKGKTVKITIKGTDLKIPIQISDPKILESFQVWTDPGTSTADRQSLIIDWSQGPVRKPPESLRRYQVSFHADPKTKSFTWSITRSVQALSRVTYMCRANPMNGTDSMCVQLPVE
jgi:hypothetical protein